MKKIPKEVGNQCKRLFGKEYEEEVEEAQAGGLCLYKTDLDYFYVKSFTGKDQIT